MAAHAAPLDAAESRRLGRWLRRRAGGARQELAGAVGGAALAGLLLGPQAWLLARVVDGVLTHHRPLGAETPLLWALLAVFAARAALGAMAEGLAQDAALTVRAGLRAELLRKLTRLHPREIAARPSGGVATLLTEGIAKLDPFYAAYLPQAAMAAFLPFALLAMVFPADWVAGVIMLLSAPLLPLFMIVVGKGAEALNKRSWHQLSLLGAHLFDVIAGLTTLKRLNASAMQARVVAEVSEDYRRSVMAVLRVAFLSALVLEFFATLSVAMVAVYVGFRLYYGGIAFLPGFFVLLLAPEFYRPLRAMGAQHHARMEALAVAEEITALLDTPEPESPTAAVALNGSVREIRLEDVSFAYQPARPVLDHLSITLRRGERVALLGATGSGKSTMVRLLLGLETPNAGRILVDGVNLRDAAQAAWFSRVAWLPQAPTLCAGSVAEILRLSRPTASDEELYAALRRAGAEEVLAKLPHGLSTRLGEHGAGLSGGQIRRLALARALLKPAELYVFDEPEASLDGALIRHINALSTELAREHAVLVVAHRPEAVAGFDRVLQLSEGRLC
ncbi:thiol reductant ABC exporter subunit CydD [Acidocella sp. KAb 2-4]|uniref:thiol reductant ABC exporter subunit CydD n=1 Tax=Acidocella sp. KAb 2-4 TaxID=2885158 RepID=UPI001D081640|nr:thiol reductant ABC exporter subunit CydD [Acidocella sp. KAb 2-4]MCB5943450.1 thiol reductant ABC exporter subunit CydD [Acidocella sp. KAb 2-4]